MIKYQYLVNILDKIRDEAPMENKRYHPNHTEFEQLNQARARVFIHLFLKVKFGITAFLERENFITDDTDDGGLDGYFIDEEAKELYFIQSKFRNSSFNFENKEITFEELLSMDIKRITEGETTYESGKNYNNKILKFIGKLQNISDLPKYRFKVILLANVKESLQPKINKLMGGFKVEIYNYDRCYSELVFPLVSGTYYNINELKITINVDRNSAGNRIQYYVKTLFYECTVNALFIPTLEIAKILSKYKNSILKFNPRSYLDLASGSVNAQIAKSIYEIDTNEFAIFNNGITILSDNAVYSDSVAKKNKAEVIITNPQVINGGQTAYTLSVIYEDCIKNKKTLDIFDGKEVLLKIISFPSDNNPEIDVEGKKIKLIEDISIATNQQSPVTEADRRANDKVQIDLQNKIFKEFGLYYERKRGEFDDGIRQGYIDNNKIINRELFVRVCLSAQNKPNTARQKGQDVFFSKKIFDNILPNALEYRKYVFAYMAFERINGFTKHVNKYGRYAITCVVANRYIDSIATDDFNVKVNEFLKDVINKWDAFLEYARRMKHNKKFFKETYDKRSGQKVIEANWGTYYHGNTLLKDLISFFKISENVQKTAENAITFIKEN